ncbi:spermatid nuclear transition protein 1 family protein [Paraprevotella xylaniphila YIT 11841]|uniref:Spermatid nuclear transition protein 1 family protein n=1 Tax=Paraprevotella xylaniphila YIT 11841 TaxID=762982 RepID=F3QU71_9BACT|nr:spermatid nuclear transition protein 1 family protein [Paraprevotella xylaniphila YIT 11841]
MFKVTFCAFLRGKNHLPYNVKSFCAKRKINRRRLKNRLAQNENPISEDGSECV